LADRPTFSILHTSARPAQWRAVYDTWLDWADRPEDVEYVLVIDPRWGFQYDGLDLVQSCWGLRTQDKIIVNTGRMCYVDGVNLAAAASTGRVLIVNADDQYPCEHWDSQLLNALDRATVKGKVGLEREVAIRISTGTPNEHERRIMVAPILSRALYDRWGYVFYPEYESMFSDNDFCEHALQDGVIVEAQNLVFPHRHPSFDQSVKVDAAYQRQNRQEAYEAGAAILARRRASGFGSKLAVVPSPLVPNTGKNLVICLPGEWFHSTWVAQNALQLCCHLFNRFKNVWPVMPVMSHVHMMRHGCFEYIKSLPQPVDYVLWIDDDNLLSPEHFEMLLNDLETNPQLAGAVGWCWIHPDARMSCGAFDEKGACHSFDYHKIIEVKDGDLIPIEWSGFPIVLHRGSVIDEIGEFPFRAILNDNWRTGITGEDTAFFMHATEKGLQFVCDRRVKVPHLKYGVPEPDWLMKEPRKTTAASEWGEPAAKPELTLAQFRAENDTNQNEDRASLLSWVRKVVGR
jgi:hypothetical protein